MTDLLQARLWKAAACIAVAAAALAVMGWAAGTAPSTQGKAAQDLRNGAEGPAQGRAEPERLAAQARGRALFEGQTDLRGRLAGHELPLPVMATRCSNCHETTLSAARALPAGVPAMATPAETARQAASQAAAPPATQAATQAVPQAAPRAAPRGSWTAALAQAPPSLTAQGLTVQRVRRGGPPSAYDATRLCLLLRSGRDAADVLVSTTMPRYDVTDAQCADLWAFLGSPGGAL